MVSDRRAAEADVRAPLWLAHHRAGELGRCVCVGRTAICRRCVVLYPSVLGWWILGIWLAPPAATLVALGWVLPLPMAVDWVLEHLGRFRPDPWRLTGVTLLAAPGLAALLLLHTTDAAAHRALLPAAVYGSIAVGAAWWGARSRAPRDWHEEHLADEARRTERLRALVDVDDTSGIDHVQKRPQS